MNRVLVEQFKEAVEKHVTANHDVAFYADLLGRHPDHLSRVVRVATGIGAKQWITRALTSRAAAMLSQGTRVDETARALGFDDPSYFSRWFHRETGSRARDLRRSAR